VEKLLSIVWYKVLPPVFGGQKGIAGFNKHLSMHRPLVCLCSENNEPAGHIPYKIIPELPVSKTQFLTPSCWKKIETVAQREEVTHIILEHPYHAIAAYRAQKITGAKIIIHSHNMESERFRQLGKWWWRILRRYEKWAHRKAALSLFKTQGDKEFAIVHFGLRPEQCVVVPYGIDQPVKNVNAGSLIRQRHGIGSEEKILLFAGTLDYTPNTEAVKHIIHTVAPDLENSGIAYRIIICGRDHKKNLDSISHPKVIQAGEVPDIENYFSAADVFINPVLTGAGIQTKNIDALSYHCTTVCFEKMAAGIPVSICGNKLLLAENGNWDNFRAMIIKATTIHENTPGNFFNYFGWENILQSFIQQLSTVTSRPS
jgi:glycosyltransferase involved in cell wall biosynthesis